MVPKVTKNPFALLLWVLCSLSQMVVFSIIFKSNRKHSAQEQVKVTHSKMPLELEKCLGKFSLFQHFKLFPTLSKNEQLILPYQVVLAKLS